MEDVLKVANMAHQAAQIYAQEKKSRSKDQAAKDIYLANALSLGSLDRDIATEMMQDEVVGACPTCIHDYIASCPVGWTADEEGSLCLAASSYQGPCSSELFVGELTSQDKAKIEVRCSICWPCNHDGPRTELVAQQKNSPNDSAFSHESQA
jgi:CPW-WPC domain-containing protein